MVVTHINTQRGTQPHCLSNVSNNGAKSESLNFRGLLHDCAKRCGCMLCCISSLAEHGNIIATQGACNADARAEFSDFTD